MRVSLSAAAAFAVIGISAAAAAQTLPPPRQLRSIEVQCVRQIGERMGLWPAWLKCEARRIWGWNGRVQNAYAQCWVPIWNERAREGTCNQCGAPTLTALRCMSKRLSR